MQHEYSEDRVRNVARECREFEHVISAMGYGYSFLNVSQATFIRRCPDCVNWFGGSCAIFQDEVKGQKQ